MEYKILSRGPIDLASFLENTGLDRGIVIKDVKNPYLKAVRKNLSGVAREKTIRNRIEARLASEKAILDNLSGAGQVRIHDLMKEAGISLPTCRRDIKELEKRHPGITAKIIDKPVAPVAAKAFNIDVFANPVPYDRLEFITEYDGAYFNYDRTMAWADEFLRGSYSEFIELEPGAGPGAKGVKKVIGEALELLFAAIRESNNGSKDELEEYIREGLMTHRTLQIRIARNLSQNACLYADDLGQNVLVLNNYFFGITDYLYQLADPKLIKILEECAGDDDPMAALEGRIGDENLSRIFEILQRLEEVFGKPRGGRTPEIRDFSGLYIRLNILCGLFDDKAALWPLCERLFHELSHSNEFDEPQAEIDEECECAYRDYLLYKYALTEGGTSVKRESVDAVTRMKKNFYRSSGYFKFLNTLILVGDDKLARSVIADSVISIGRRILRYIGVLRGDSLTGYGADSIRNNR